MTPYFFYAPFYYFLRKVAFFSKVSNDDST